MNLKIPNLNETQLYVSFLGTLRGFYSSDLPTQTKFAR